MCSSEHHLLYLWSERKRYRRGRRRKKKGRKKRQGRQQRRGRRRRRRGRRRMTSHPSLLVRMLGVSQLCGPVFGFGTCHPGTFLVFFFLQQERLWSEGRTFLGGLLEVMREGGVAWPVLCGLALDFLIGQGILWGLCGLPSTEGHPALDSKQTRVAWFSSDAGPLAVRGQWLLVMTATWVTPGLLQLFAKAPTPGWQTPRYVLNFSAENPSLPRS